MTTPNRRRTDRIREICARMLVAPDEELLILNAQLREALVEHSLQLENLALAAALGLPSMPAERRSRTRVIPPGAKKVIPPSAKKISTKDAKSQKRES